MSIDDFQQWKIYIAHILDLHQQYEWPAVVEYHIYFHLWWHCEMAGSKLTQTFLILMSMTVTMPSGVRFLTDHQRRISRTKFALHLIKGIVIHLPAFLVTCTSAKNVVLLNMGRRITRRTRDRARQACLSLPLLLARASSHKILHLLCPLWTLFLTLPFHMMACSHLLYLHWLIPIPIHPVMLYPHPIILVPLSHLHFLLKLGIIFFTITLTKNLYHLYST